MQKNNKNKQIKICTILSSYAIKQEKLFSFTISFLNSQTSAHARMSKNRQVESSDPVPKAWNQMKERQRGKGRDREGEKERERKEECVGEIQRERERDRQRETDRERQRVRKMNKDTERER